MPATSFRKVGTWATKYRESCEMLQKPLFRTFHRLGGSLVTGDCITVRYDRSKFKRLSRLQARMGKRSPLCDTGLYKGYYTWAQKHYINGLSVKTV